MGRPILWSEWSSRAPSLFAVLTSTDLLIQYYKILNLGVPLEAVQQRMYMEGYDPQALNVDLFNKVQRKMRQEDFDYEEGKDVDAQYNKVRAMLYANAWGLFTDRFPLWLFGCCSTLICSARVSL